MTKNGKKNSSSIELAETIKSRKSTLLVGAVFTALAAWNVHRGRITLAECLGTAGILLLLMGAFLPAASRRFYAWWMMLASVLSYVNTRILLTVMYMVAMVPFGFFVRLFGHDPLQRRAPAGESYWIPRAITRQTREGFEKSF
jgi:hypothetical protein